MAKQSENKINFEQAMKQIEKIVSEVEQGEIPLEKTIEQYENGMKLIQHCRAILEQAEKRIEIIDKKSKKSPSELNQKTDEGDSEPGS